MKIGILTYHRANNVGGVLQNYALQQILINKNYDVETIDYICEKIEKENRIFKWNGFKPAIKRCLELFPFITRENKFKKFRSKHLKLSRKYTRENIKETNLVYDKFIVGSDQVWNTLLNNRDMTYFLDFVDSGRKKNSYAASFGSDQFRLNEKVELVNYLKEFNYISVRENEGKEMLALEGINSRVNLDPTLLLEKEKWDLLLERPLNFKDNEPFVFVYIVANTPQLLVKAKEYAKKNNMTLYCMHYNYRKYSDCVNLRSVSPGEFLFYIKNAHKVYCSSFHAVCFSIIYQRDFVCALDESRNNNNTRLITLCNNLELGHTILGDDRFEERTIDYKNTKSILESYKTDSLASLEEML